MEADKYQNASNRVGKTSSSTTTTSTTTSYSSSRKQQQHQQVSSRTDYSNTRDHHHESVESTTHQNDVSDISQYLDDDFLKEQRFIDDFVESSLRQDKYRYGERQDDNVNSKAIQHIDSENNTSTLSSASTAKHNSKVSVKSIKGSKNASTDRKFDGFKKITVSSGANQVNHFSRTLSDNDSGQEEEEEEVTEEVIIPTSESKVSGERRIDDLYPKDAAMEENVERRLSGERTFDDVYSEDRGAKKNGRTAVDSKSDDQVDGRRRRPQFVKNQPIKMKIDVNHDVEEQKQYSHDHGNENQQYDDEHTYQNNKPIKMKIDVNSLDDHTTHHQQKTQPIRIQVDHRRGQAHPNQSFEEITYHIPPQQEHSYQQQHDHEEDDFLYHRGVEIREHSPRDRHPDYEEVVTPDYEVERHLAKNNTLQVVSQSKSRKQSSPITPADVSTNKGRIRVIVSPNPQREQSGFIPVHKTEVSESENRHHHDYQHHQQRQNEFNQRHETTNDKQHHHKVQNSSQQQQHHQVNRSSNYQNRYQHENSHDINQNNYNQQQPTHHVKIIQSKPASQIDITDSSHQRDNKENRDFNLQQTRQYYQQKDVVNHQSENQQRLSHGSEEIQQIKSLRKSSLPDGFDEKEFRRQTDLQLQRQRNLQQRMSNRQQNENRGNAKQQSGEEYRQQQYHQQKLMQHQQHLQRIQQQQQQQRRQQEQRRRQQQESTTVSDDPETLQGHVVLNGRIMRRHSFDSPSLTDSQKEKLQGETQATVVVLSPERAQTRQRRLSYEHEKSKLEEELQELQEMEIRNQRTKEATQQKMYEQQHQTVTTTTTATKQQQQSLNINQLQKNISRSANNTPDVSKQMKYNNTGSQSLASTPNPPRKRGKISSSLKASFQSADIINDNSKMGGRRRSNPNLILGRTEVKTYGGSNVDITHHSHTLPRSFGRNNKKQSNKKTNKSTEATKESKSATVRRSQSLTSQSPFESTSIFDESRLNNAQRRYSDKARQQFATTTTTSTTSTTQQRNKTTHQILTEATQAQRKGIHFDDSSLNIINGSHVKQQQEQRKRQQQADQEQQRQQEQHRLIKEQEQQIKQQKLIQQQRLIKEQEQQIKQQKLIQQQRLIKEQEQQIKQQKLIQQQRLIQQQEQQIKQQRILQEKEQQMQQQERQRIQQQQQKQLIQQQSQQHLKQTHKKTSRFEILFKKPQPASDAPPKPKRQVTKKKTQHQQQEDIYQSIKVSTKGGVITLFSEKGHEQVEVSDTARQHLAHSMYGTEDKSQQEAIQQIHQHQRYQQEQHREQEQQHYREQHRQEQEQHRAQQRHENNNRFMSHSSYQDDSSLYSDTSLYNLEDERFNGSMENIYYTVCTYFFHPEHNDWIQKIHRMGKARVPPGGGGPHSDKCVFLNRLDDPDREEIVVHKLLAPEMEHHRKARTALTADLNDGGQEHRMWVERAFHDTYESEIDEQHSRLGDEGTTHSTFDDSLLDTGFDARSIDSQQSPAVYRKGYSTGYIIK